MSDNNIHHGSGQDGRSAFGRGRDWVARLFGAVTESKSLQSFRRLAMQLEFDLGGVGRGRALMLTPAGAADDAAHAALELAHVLGGEMGKSVLIIDGGFGGSALTRALGLGDAAGLVDALRGAIVEPRPLPGESGHAVILPRGSAPGNASVRLAAPEVRRVLEEARSKYDYILISTDSVHDDSRCLVFPPAVDRVLLLAVEGRTLLDSLDTCRRALQGCSETRVGLVLTRAWRPLGIL